ncbi:MAG: HAMP domain-containing protein [Chthoniobacteraceae bacterium]
MSPPTPRRRAGWLQSLRTKIALAMTVVALTTAAAFILPALHLRKTAVLHDFQMFVSSVAGTTALAIDGDSIASITTNEDAASPAFQKARSVLDRSRTVNHLREEEIYLLRPLPTPGESEFVVMIQQKTFIGDHYRVLDENWPRLSEAWQTGRATFTGLYEDPHGRWISGYAPILASDGKPVAIIEVDAEVSRYYAELDRTLWMSLALGAAALLVGMLPGLWLAGGITRGLQRLTVGIQRFRAGDTAVQVEAESNDEVGILSNAFNDLFEGLQEKLALLPIRLAPECRGRVAQPHRSRLAHGPRTGCDGAFRRHPRLHELRRGSRRAGARARAESTALRASRRGDFRRR